MSQVNTIKFQNNVRIDGQLLIADIDTRIATTLLLGKDIATKLELADTGITTEVQGLLTALEGVTVTGTLAGDNIDSATATILTVGASIATKLELADTAVTTEIQGPLTALEGVTVTGTLASNNIDTVTSTILTVGASTATKVELADTVVTTEVQGPLTALEGVTVTGALAGDELNIDNININGNVVSSTNTNGDISLLPNGTGKVLLKADPIVALGAATKQYVDSVISGLDLDTKESVRVKTVASLSTYTQSGSGVGATLTASSNGSLTIDSILTVANDRVLVDTNGSTSDVHNGIYVVTQVGDGSNPWILTRSDDASLDSKVTSGLFVFVEEGTLSADNGYILTTDGTIIVDTTALTFTQFSGAGQITVSNIGSGGAGIFKQKTGNLIEFKNINAGSSKISINDDTGNDEIDIDVVEANLDHGSIGGLGDDDHTQYALLAGRSGGQTYVGGTAASDDLTLSSTSNVSKGNVIIEDALTALGGVSVTGNVTVSGTVDGRDVSTDGTTLDSHIGNTSNPHSVTAAQIGNSTAQWNANKVQGTNVSSTSPADNQVLVYNSTASEWALSNINDVNTRSSVFDDFHGSEIKTCWLLNTVGTNSDASIIDGIGGVIRLTSDNTASDYADVSFAQKSIKLSANSVIKFRLKLDSTTQNTVTFGVMTDSNNLVEFSYDATVSANTWKTHTRLTGTTTENTITDSPNTSYHLFEIVCSSSDVKFYYDGTLKFTHSTNLPTGLMKIFMRQTSKTTTSRNLDVDFVETYSDRE